MVTTPKTIDCFFQESMVTAIEIATHGDKLAIGRVDGSLSIHQTSDKSILFEHEFDSKIIALKFKNNDLRVATENGGIWLIADGKVNEAFTFENGLLSSQIDASVVGIDSLENLHVFTMGEDINLGEYNNFTKSLTGMLASNAEGEVVNFSPSGDIVWKRTSTDQYGDQITCLEHSGNLQLIGREGSSVSELPSYQLEIHDENGLKHTIDFTRPVTCARILSHFKEDYFAVVGDFDGQLYTISESGQKNKFAKLKYPAFHIIDLIDGVMVASWFNLQSFDYQNGELQWTVEHLGITEYVSISTNRKVIAFAGEDQNDWTGSEPVGLINLENGLIELDKSELTLWASKEIIPEYKDDQSIYKNLEDVEELAGDVESSFKVQDISGSLLDALNSDTENENSNDNEEIFEIDDLLSEIDETNSLKAQPQAVVSEDIIAQSKDDGTAVVLLDGSESVDPHRQIKVWRWLDSNGNEIASTPKAKVKLNKGSYRFTLEVYDDEHRMSSDSLSVQIR